MQKFLLLAPILFLTSCYHVERNCKDFKTGKFQSEITIDGVKHETVTIRTDSLVIETYKGKTDTSSIRWVNDCEYVLRKINPKNMKEQKAIAIKILTTTEKTYTFEFGTVGSNQKQKGTATRIN
ncbi:DNA topoisomerase IV [Flavobacterium sp.]|uniref:DNA topoisomerase IV n=1 Tax=Flavobacterium sp. TaxID=239 RepID=UPI0039E5EE40